MGQYGAWWRWDEVLTSQHACSVANQSIFVRTSPNGVVREGLIAACLTSIMILVFLGSWRSTLIICMPIPPSILTSLLILSALGESINIMTLGTLALAVGVLVDDATVEIENMPGAASLRGTGELVQAEPDGYTFGLINPPSSPVSAMTNPPGYDMTEVEGICAYGTTSYVAIALGIAPKTKTSTTARLGPISTLMLVPSLVLPLPPFSSLDCQGSASSLYMDDRGCLS